MSNESGPEMIWAWGHSGDNHPIRGFACEDDKIKTTVGVAYRRADLVDAEIERLRAELAAREIHLEQARAAGRTLQKILGQERQRARLPAELVERIKEARDLVEQARSKMRMSASTA